MFLKMRGFHGEPRRTITAAVLLPILSLAIVAAAGPKRGTALPTKAGRHTTVAVAATGTATFTGIGFLPGDDSSQVRAVNADGTVAIGASGSGTNLNSGLSGRLTVEWTAAGGLVGLPAIPADGTTQSGTQFLGGSDITPSGSWIAYRARPGGTGKREAAICNADFSQIIPLGRLAANRDSVGNQISDDGSVVFGFAADVNFDIQAFRWSSLTGTLQQLTPPVGYNSTLPSGRACSSDGSVSVGATGKYDENSGDELDVQAYHWTEADGMQLLGYLPGGNRSAALAISADGSTIFGVSRSTNAPGTGQTNGWDYSGELFVWTEATGSMTALGVPAGYDEFANFAGMSADGALLATIAGDSTGQKPDTFFVIKTATKEPFNAYDLLVSAGAGSGITGWSKFDPLGLSDNGDTIFGAAIDPNGHAQGWIANFPVGYLRNVQTFSASDSSTSVDITSGGFVGHDGSYSASDATIGGTVGTSTSRSQNLTARRPSGGAANNNTASLTLGGTAALSLTGAVTVNSGGSLNLLDGATVTCSGMTMASGGTFGVELDAAAAQAGFARLTVNGQASAVDLTGQPTLNLILSFTPPPNAIFTLIQNNSGNIIQGQFAGVTEEQFITIASTHLRVTYKGGSSGNDFVVRVLPAVQITSADRSNSDFSLTGKAEPGATVQIETTADLTQQFAPLTTVQADATTGAFEFADAAPPPAAGFYRAVYAN